MFFGGIGRGLKCPVEEVRVGSQQKSVSKSEGITLCLGESFWQPHRRKGRGRGPGGQGTSWGVNLKAHRGPDEGQEQAPWQQCESWQGWKCAEEGSKSILE